MTPEVLAKDVHLFGIEPGYLWSEILPRETFSTPFSGKSEQAGIAFNYYLKKKPEGDVTIQIHQGAVKINEIKGTAEPGLNSILWPMTREQAAARRPAGRQRQMPK